MADVLEAMGFPSEWCERALSSTSGIERAVDLLLQWQAQGMPQPLHSSSSAQISPSDSRSTPGGAPTLKLLPLPSIASKPVVDERERSPSSTLIPSSSPCPFSLEGPSGVTHPENSEFPPSSFPRDAGLRRDAPASRIVPSANSERDLMSAARNSGVPRVSRGSGSCAGSSTAVDNLDCSDAVVPDAYAEERKARFIAARRAKQEKENERARIRQHMQEDMALRRFRNSYQSPPEIERNKSPLPADSQRAGGSTAPRVVSMDSAVELQIRCPGSQNLKASFSAGAKLKDVRAYVEHQLQQPHRVLASQDRHTGLRPGSVPFTGQSARLSSDRDAERELLQAARENFEVQTSRILASAKVLRTGVPQNGSGGRIYFLIPFPRQEFFSESAMELTLAEAQLVPRGTLVVQYKPNETEKGKNVQPYRENRRIKLDTADSTDEGDSLRTRRPEAGEALMVAESVRCQVRDVESDDCQIVDPREKPSPSFDPVMNETLKSGRTLEMEGERVRVRERALQAAAKRMSEAARIFHAGLPLEEGETGEAFHFPTDAENQKVPSPRETAPAVPSVPMPKDVASLHRKTAGADAELSDALNPNVERLPLRDGTVKWPPDRSLDALHRQAVAAAEARLRSSQLQVNVLGGDCRQEPEEAESRICEDEFESRPIGGRTRIPQSLRLLSRPEKLQRTSSSSSPSNSPVAREALKIAERQVIGGSSSWQQSQPETGAASRTAPLEAALHRFKANTEGDNKGKGIVEEHVSPQVAVPSSSLQPETERSSSLRVRLEDGNVILHTFPASTLLQAVRDSVVPEGASTSEYGFVVPFPEPHFVEGEALAATLEEVGLVPRGTVHLTKLATRGMVRQGRRISRRRRYTEEIDDLGQMEGVVGHLRERMIDSYLSYEELMDLEESIGRVNVGVPEEVMTTLPIHIVKARNAGKSPEDNPDGGEELDLCIVCMAEMADGEEALCLPCAHTFHTVCIRQWLLQSTRCPTCKHPLV